MTCNTRLKTLKYSLRLDIGVFASFTDSKALTNHQLEPFQRHENSDKFIEDFLMYKKIFKV